MSRIVFLRIINTSLSDTKKELFSSRLQKAALEAQVQFDRVRPEEKEMFQYFHF